VLERLKVRAGQLPVIVNTAIVPWSWCRPAGGSLAALIGPVEAAGVTVVRPVWLAEPADPVEVPVPAVPLDPVEPEALDVVEPLVPALLPDALVPVAVL
jgi:hypothetical protein